MFDSEAKKNTKEPNSASLDIENLLKGIEDQPTSEELSSFSVSDRLVDQANQRLNELSEQERQQLLDEWIDKDPNSLPKVNKLIIGAHLKALVQLEKAYLETRINTLLQGDLNQLTVDRIRQIGRLISAGFDISESTYSQMPPEKLVEIDNYINGLHLDDENTITAADNLLFGLSTDIYYLSEYSLRKEASLEDIPRLKEILKRYKQDSTFGGTTKMMDIYYSMSEIAFFLVLNAVAKGETFDEDWIHAINETMQPREAARFFALAGQTQKTYDLPVVQDVLKSNFEGNIFHLKNTLLHRIIAHQYDVPAGSPIEKIISDKSIDLDPQWSFSVLVEAVLSYGPELNGIPPAIKKFIEDSLTQIDKDHFPSDGLEQLTLICTAFGVDFPQIVQTTLNSKPDLPAVKMHYLTAFHYETSYKHSIDLESRWKNSFLLKGYEAFPPYLREKYSQDELLDEKEVGTAIIKQLKKLFKEFVPMTGDDDEDKQAFVEFVRGIRDKIHPDVSKLLLRMNLVDLAHALKQISEEEIGVFKWPGFDRDGVVRMQVEDILPKEVIDTIRQRMAEIADVEKIEGGHWILASLADDELLSKFPVHQQNLIRLVRNHPQDAELIYSVRNAIYQIPPERINEYFEVLAEISSSPVPEVIRIREQLIISVMETSDPKAVFEEILDIFVKNNLPTSGKVLKIFQILFPMDVIGKKFADTEKLSPVLGRLLNEYQQLEAVNEPRAEQIKRMLYGVIYADILKTDIRSSNDSLRVYLTELLSVLPILVEAEGNPQSILENQKDTELLFKTLKKLKTLYTSATDLDLILDENDLAGTIENFRMSMGISESEHIEDWFRQNFLKPLGYQSIDEVLQAMDEVRRESDQFNREQIVTDQDLNRRIIIHSGDLLKGTHTPYLYSFVQNGFRCPEMLGAASSGDGTPFDIDTSQVLMKDLIGNNQTTAAIEASVAKSYGDVMILIRLKDGMKRSEHGAVNKYDPNAFEFFQSAVHGERHTGIRSGIGWYDVNAFIAKKPESVSKLEFFINTKGCFIPVVDVSGNILYDESDFDRDQQEFESIRDVNFNEILDSEEDISSDQIFSILSRPEYLQKLFESASGVGEGFTLGKHTGDVMSNFDRFFSDFESPLLTRNEMRILLFLHDIGKSLAVQLENNSHDQHIYTEIIVNKLLENSNLDSKKIELIVKITSNDLFGQFIQGNLSVPAMQKLIERDATFLGVEPRDYLHLIQTYYLCDAGAYTEFSGGIRSLDSLFSLSEDGSRLSLNAELTEKVRQIQF